MTGQWRTESRVTLSVAPLSDDVRTPLEAIGSALLRLALIALALLLILVILPVVLDAA
jgi:hypothetical protein